MDGLVQLWLSWDTQATRMHYEKKARRQEHESEMLV